MKSYQALIRMLFIFLILLPATTRAQVLPGKQETQTIARRAYIYGFPMVMNYKTMYQYAVDTGSPDYKGPFNEVSCEARLFTPDDRAVVTPNADTPYCMFWIDLRAEPMVLHVPEMEESRYYSFQLIDFYTHNFGYIGTLSTGNKAGDFLLAGPGWNGEKPADITGVIHSETSFVFNVARTQLFGSQDLENVKTIQLQYTLLPLSEFLGEKAPALPALPEFPKWVEGAQFDERFFTYLNFALEVLSKPGPHEEELWQDLARLGIGPGMTFDITALPVEQVQALRVGVQEGLAEMDDFRVKYAGDPLISGKIFGTRSFLSQSAVNNYSLINSDILRAVAAQMGLYGNSAAEAIYPTFFTDSDNTPLDGAKHSYTLRFAPGSLPPVKAFWSLTMYDGTTQLFIENPLNRYLLNSEMMGNFKLEADGALVLHIGKDSPGMEQEANWLPAPEGLFYLVMRLYGPEQAALEGRWTPPVLEKVK